ncbi:PREDICTED: noggin-1-like [Aptenodytes forsteri]|uniref:noggin-1-like n=1 Tax=Aptenodytes forsteri TaxID=9233 RepID=UPI000905B5F5|nr:PREDICTED: noggin-1-like [Aptenodytes forsteri]
MLPNTSGEHEYPSREPREPPPLPPSGTAAPAAHLLRLWREAEGLGLPPPLPPGPGLPPQAPGAPAHNPRQWLVERAACRLTSTWVDLGPVFWPRWVRHTACETGPPGCSWPPGMTCRPAQLTHIKLLAWHCWAPRSPGPPHCAWRQIPYPVVAACKCSCR